MTSKTFIDTNIFVYSLDKANPEKQKQARKLLKSAKNSGSGVISTQILQEFYITATTKLKIDQALAREVTLSLTNFDLVTVDKAIIRKAIDCAAASNISFWDALVISSAVAGGCKTVWTEDLNHNQVINGVKIENPFI